MYDSIKDKYVEIIIELIKEKYNIQKINISDKKYFNQVQVKDFFETDGKFDDEKIRRLLLLNFGEIKDINISNYINTAYLCYSNFKVSNLLEKRGIKKSKANRIKYRQEFVQNYNNLWLKNFLDNNKEYYKNEENFKCFINKAREEFEDFNNEITLIIDYDLISASLRHEILVSSNISICPYCNRQYISSYKKNEKQTRPTADLDHFYPKSIFQLFSLSLYNFIPACQICNRYFKGKNIKKILYPFEKEFGEEAKFGISVQDRDACYGLNNHFDIDIEVKNDSSNKKEIENNMEVFNLESIYQNHKPYVQEILQKKELIYTNEYFEMMNNTFNDLNLTKEQIDTFYYGFNINGDINKDTKPLGKLTRDIFKK